MLVVGLYPPWYCEKDNIVINKMHQNFKKDMAQKMTSLISSEHNWLSMMYDRDVVKVISMKRLPRLLAHDLNMRVTDMSIDARSLSVNIFPSVSIHISRCVFLVFSVFS